MKLTNIFAERQMQSDEYGTLGLSLVHELSNSVSALLMDIERLRLNSTAIQQSLRQAQEHIHQFDESQLYLRHELRTLIKDFSAACETRSINLTLYAPKEFSIVGSAHKFSIVMTNLIRNAIDACSSHKPSTIAVELRVFEKSIRISVSDTGVGIPKEQLQNIFLQGFSTKSASANMGVGLALTKRIVERDFNGTLRAHSTESSTTFTVSIPRGSHES